MLICGRRPERKAPWKSTSCEGAPISGVSSGGAFVLSGESADFRREKSYISKRLILSGSRYGRVVSWRLNVDAHSILYPWNRAKDFPKEIVTLPGETEPSSALVDACYALLLVPKSAALN
jgi:hypothetical protein